MGRHNPHWVPGECRCRGQVPTFVAAARCRLDTGSAERVDSHGIEATVRYERALSAGSMERLPNLPPPGAVTQATTWATSGWPLFLGSASPSRPSHTSHVVKPPNAFRKSGIGVVSDSQWLRREIERSYRLMRGVTDPVTKDRLAEHIRGLEAALREAERGGRPTRPIKPPKRKPPGSES
jgi:hypothetical protein